MDKAKVNFWIDFSIFIFFISAFLTGCLLPASLPKGNQITTLDPFYMTLQMAHRLTTILMGLGCILHIRLHWSWYQFSLKRVASKALTGRQIPALVVNILLTMVFFGSLISGILIGVNPNANTLCLALHKYLSITMALLTVRHIVAHRKWIGTKISLYIYGKESPKLPQTRAV